MNGQPQNNLNLTPSEEEELIKLGHKHPVVQKLHSLYTLYTQDPNVLWRGMLMFAQQEINTQLKDKRLDIVNDGFHKSLWEMLKGGGSVAKTLASAKLEAKTEAEDPEPSKEVEQEKIPVITAETAHVRTH